MARERNVVAPPGLAVWVLVASLGLTGCGGAQLGEAQNAARTHGAALVRHDASAAYAQSSELIRARYPENKVHELLNANARELTQAGTQLVETQAAQVHTRAHATTPTGESFTLHEHDGRWFIDGNVFTGADLTTPLDTVAALRRALTRRSMPGFERVLSRSAREDVDAEIERILTSFDDPLALDVRVEGNTATIRAPSGQELHLVREAGEWRISEIR